MQDVSAEVKPNIPDNIFFNGGSEPAGMSPELEKAIGQAINDMLNPKLSNMHSEISEREKILLQGLYIKSISFYEPPEGSNYPRLYQTDRLQKGVAVGRARAKEMVEILKEVQMYKSQRSLLNRVKTGLFG